MFEYEYMRIAFLVGIMLAIMIPLLGAPLVQKRLSATGDALSHTSLLGVAIGLIAGVSSPIYIAMIVCVIAALIIEFMRKKFKKYQELSIVIVMSISIALAGILATKTGTNAFSRYLFGSILLISKEELITISVIFFITITLFIGFYRYILYSSYNELQAKLDGIKVEVLNIVQTIITAMVIALASKMIGVLMISALMTIPYASSLQLTRSYKNSLIVSVIVSLVSVIAGIIVSYYAQVSPGSMTVLIDAIFLIISIIINNVFKLKK